MNIERIYMVFRLLLRIEVLSECILNKSAQFGSG